MKKKNAKNLLLNKKVISYFKSASLVAGHDAVEAQTCEGPCQGGSGCCDINLPPIIGGGTLTENCKL